MRPFSMMVAGWHVEKYHGGQWGTVAWFDTLPAAEREIARIMMLGAWSGLPPRISTYKQGTLERMESK